jgi:MHS family citrate/tricarballylate:H+ symporter-like MFS transporter
MNNMNCQTQAAVSEKAVAAPSKIGAVLRVTSGNFLEQFDFFLFGFYANYISKVFFPVESEFASLMLTFAVFGAGFLMRPLGAIILGGYIDSVGRRQGLIVTLSIMASGTVLIALVPSYATIGLLAPALVLVGRLLQGFSAGAELGGVSVYLAEIATPGHKGFYTAWQSASQQVAIVFAAAIGYGLNLWLSAEELSTWGWRVPFLIGCAIVPLIFFLRRSLQETSAFQARRHHPGTREIFHSMLQNWRTVLTGMLFVAMTTTTFYLITVYTPTFGRKVLHLSAADSLLVTLLVGVSNFVWLPIGGALSDKVGRKPILIAISTLALLTAYPAMSWLAAAPSFAHLLAVLLLFSSYFGLYNGAMVVALTEVMPVSVRVVGFSLAFSLATALFGGFTPAISTYLIDVTGNSAGPGIWLSCAALSGLLATLIFYRRDGAANRALAIASPGKSRPE